MKYENRFALLVLSWLQKWVSQTTSCILPESANGKSGITEKIKCYLVIHVDDEKRNEAGLSPT